MFMKTQQLSEKSRKMPMVALVRQAIENMEVSNRIQNWAKLDTLAKLECS
jgi:hypothetical protein